MNKDKIKGIVIGMLIMTFLTGGIVFANEVVTRQIHYNVNVNVDGRSLQLAGIDRPFIMDGRTFLPVSVIAQELGVPVQWDAPTNTVFVGNRWAGQTANLNDAAPMFDWGGGGTPVAELASVSMGGVNYANVLRFQRNNTGSSNRFSLHNLNGDFRVLTGYFGRVDGSSMNNATLRIYGDGNLLFTHDFAAASMPIPVSAFVEGVTQLRIEVRSSGNFHYALQGFLE